MTLERFVERPGLAIERCHDMAGLLRAVSRREMTVIVLDLTLSKEADINLVSFVQQRNPSTRMVLLFEMEDLEKALEGIRHGAFFYLPRSSPPSDVALAVQKALDNRQAELHLDDYEQSVFEELVGRTDAMRRVVELIRKVAPTDSTVLLLGESGTGKEVVAQTLHRLSPRRDKAFVAVNCAALTQTLLESELFGHVRGAFTGADTDKMGLFEAADGGTLFLDEVGDMEPITQAKVLRVLQNGEIRPVGDPVTRKVNVRVIAATNRDLLEAVQSLAFREDLYYRLNVIQIRIPPLRERMDALPALVNHFLALYNGRHNKNVRGVDTTAARYLQQYEYPGNVRELESIMAHAVIMADGEWITSVDLPEYMRQGITARPALAYQKRETLLSLAEMEEQHIRHALEVLKGNQSQAARKLGISRSTLWRKMREYNIEPPSGGMEDA
jgi:DNA-binding NtrC family response regulator